MSGAMKSRRKALLSKSREDAAYDRRRWLDVLEDISSRPNLERAQAETIAHKALALQGETDERKRELEACIVARFGPSPVAPKSAPPPPPPSVAPPAPARRSSPPPAPTASASPDRRQGVLDPGWLDPAPTSISTPTPVARRARQQPKQPVPVHVAPDDEQLFRYLLLRIGLDAGSSVIQDLRRRFVE
jgi:hypothetical protein